MERVLRRQLGAHEVNIDTEAEYASYTLWEPTRIDFHAMQSAAKDAGYTLTGVSIDIGGETVLSDCAECAGTVPMLKIAQTGQTLELELEGELEIGATVRISAKVRGWEGEHPVLSVTGARPRAE